VQHILSETRAQRRVKIGTDLGKPIFSDERDPGIVDHGYDVLRYAIAARPSVPTTKSKRVGGTFSHNQRLAKRYRQKRTCPPRLMHWLRGTIDFRFDVESRSPRQCSVGFAAPSPIIR
jgi:hypothetical protein